MTLDQFMTDYKPMIDGVKRRLSQKWFALERDEIASLVDMAIFKLWRKNKKDTFVCTKKVLQTVSERAIIKQICHQPNVEVKIVIDENGKRHKKVELHQTAYLDAEIDEDVTLMDIIPDDRPSIEDEIIEECDLQEKRAMVLAIISERTYKQLCFEYENKCVSQENLNLIQKIKKAVLKHEHN